MRLLKGSMLLVPAVLGLASTALAGESCCPTEEGAATCEMASSMMIFGIPAAWYIAPIASVVALIVAFCFYKKMMTTSEGTEKMAEIAGHVREGAYAYLFKQYKLVGIVFVLLFILFCVLVKMGVQNVFVPIAFLTSGLASLITGFLGMKTATNASARTAQGSSESLNKGLQISFRAGAVMGLVVVGFGLLNITVWYWILDQLVYTTANMTNGLKVAGMWLVQPGMEPSTKLLEIANVMVTFGMGASTQALFARVGGGIYTKAADVGADLVGKVEAGIPEDDPRNPATIADNVGDNVGDVAGMGADLFESYSNSILATAALGAAVSAVVLQKVGMDPMKAVLAPTVVAGIGIVLSIIGMFLVRCKEGASQKNLLHALLFGTLSSSVLIIIALVVMVHFGWISWGIFGSVVSGLVGGVLIGQFTEYYTSSEYKPTKKIAEEAHMGPATTIINGLATGMYSSALPVITVVAAIMCAYGFAGGFENMAMGLYGIGFAAVGMLATLGITLATDAYGPIADNAGGNAEMAGLGPEVRERTDALDSLGNTTAATGKGFAIGSAALTALALFAALIEAVRVWIARLAQENPDGIFKIGDATFAVGAKAEGVIDITTASIAQFVTAFDLSIMNPNLLCGLFIGGMMAFVFCAMTMQAVGKTAGDMVEEVRRQFREIPGIMDGSGKPDYAECVAISTKGAQREMIVPSLLAIFIPVITGLVFGVPGVMGLLAGGLSCGFVLAVTLNNAGGSWDNAKKYIETGNCGGKGSEAHKAGVVGDTVGDPFKDTSGPSLNILIKLMSMVAVVFAGVIVKFGPFIGG